LLQVFSSACTIQQTATTVGPRQGQKKTGLVGCSPTPLTVQEIEQALTINLEALN
jgi:hypothetical protein